MRTDTYKIDNISILIYNNNLEKERYSSYPFEDNARTKLGNFNFKLFPGEHSAYCFTNIAGINFPEIETFSTARFELKQNESGYYEEPPAILLESKRPFIHFPGPIVTDTVWFEEVYVGRICIAFKNMTNLSPSLTFDNIKNVEILAKGVGVTQYLSQIEITDPLETRSSRYSIDDKILLTSQLSQDPYPDFDFGFDNYYFPSLSAVDGITEPISLQLNFLSGNNNIISTLAIDLIDRLTGEAIILHTGETLLVTVDGNNIQILHLEDPSDWNSGIESGGNNTPGGGGTEI
ncbi:hypothetical protein [Dysgonomonas termitidis]|uniref:Uncharacterized protein n=1 Tax=Dysgonomonas termitidis TaxID=1516126 RepID=A0ABV9KUK5_9BACT